MADRIKVKGATSRNGNKWVLFREGKRAHWVLYAAFVSNKQEVRSDLSDHDIIIVSDSEWRDLVQRVVQLESFPKKNLIEKPGMLGTHMVLLDGSAYGPKGRIKVKTLFDPDPAFVTSGTGQQWLHQVAQPLAGQSLMSFLLMTAFAPLILTLTDRVNNFGFELVGEGGVGKSSALYVVASVCGNPSTSKGDTFWQSLHATNAGIEKMLPKFNNLPFLLDEVNLTVGSGSNQDIGYYKQLIFQLAEGKSKARYNGPKPQTYRMVYVTSSNQRLSDIIAGGHQWTNAALQDRLITLLIDKQKRPYGTFDNLPDGFKTARSFDLNLKRCIAENHGWAVRRFVRNLMIERAKDDTGLKARIAQMIQKFISAVGVDANDGSATRVAEAFGIVYAAGKLAQQFGALPDDMRPLQAAKSCYQLHLDSLGHSTLETILAGLQSGENVYRLDTTEIPHVSDKKFYKNAVFIRPGKKGRTELAISPDAWSAMVPNPKILLNQAVYQGILVCEKGRSTSKRSVRLGHKDRVHVFKLP